MDATGFAKSKPSGGHSILLLVTLPGPPVAATKLKKKQLLPNKRAVGSSFIEDIKSIVAKQRHARSTPQTHTFTAEGGTSPSARVRWTSPYLPKSKRWLTVGVPEKRPTKKWRQQYRELPFPISPFLLGIKQNLLVCRHFHAPSSKRALSKVFRWFDDPYRRRLPFRRRQKRACPAVSWAPHMCKFNNSAPQHCSFAYVWAAFSLGRR